MLPEYYVQNPDSIKEFLRVFTTESITYCLDWDFCCIANLHFKSRHTLSSLFFILIWTSLASRAALTISPTIKQRFVVLLSALLTNYEH